MTITLCFAEICFRFYSERLLYIEEELLPFQTENRVPDVSINISWNWSKVEFPQIGMLGQDALIDYYQECEKRVCLYRGGNGGPIAYTAYTDAFKHIECVIDEKRYKDKSCFNLGEILRMLPMRAVFQYYNVLFFHASQVAIDNKGILFTAPSGTGKTTQANLWKQHRQAELICNDRTLVRKKDGVWLTYGYPLDGSQPVRCNKVHELGCLVLLKQGKKSRIACPNMGCIAAFLMEQMVIDVWNIMARQKALELILSIIKEIPVFMLEATPDHFAVDVLEKELWKKGVV